MLLQTFSAGYCKLNTLCLREKSIPPGTELSMVLTRHRVALIRHPVTCNLKLRAEGIFFFLWPFSVLHYLSYFFSSKVYSVLYL